MRRGNVFRIPPPPELIGGLTNYDSDMQAIVRHLGLIYTIVNQSTQSFHNRLNTIQQIGAKAPPNVSGFAVAGKQGSFSLIWNRIKNADGYVIIQATDTAMSNIVGRYAIGDGNQCSYQIPVGNVSVTSSFQIYAYQGPEYSEPSPIITATTAVYAAAEAAPVAPPLAPLPPKKSPVRSGANLP